MKAFEVEDDSGTLLIFAENEEDAKIRYNEWYIKTYDCEPEEQITILREITKPEIIPVVGYGE